MFPLALGVDVFVVRCMLRSDQVRRCNFIGGLQAIDGDWSRPIRRMDPRMARSRRGLGSPVLLFRTRGF